MRRSGDECIRWRWMERAGGPARWSGGLAWLLSCALALALHAQAAPATGPQQLAFAGLRAALSSQGQPQGQINAVRVGATGNLYLLIDQKDGVRLLETDPAATNILNQAQIGAKGDVGLAMALDPAGNVYVTGTTTSGALTATGGAAFTAASGTATNSFVAKFSASLGSPIFVTFCGGGSMDASSIAATSDAVFITGTVYLPNGTLPVTAAGIIQTPAFGSQWNGFVEKFSASGSSLLYATYLSGAGGNTTPAAIVADASDDAYIAGTTTAPGYPTVAALVPNQLVTTALGTTSGFLTKLTPAGDGIPFSTFIPGAGISSLAIDSAAGNLLLAGSISLGQFPVASVATPLTAIGVPGAGADDAGRPDGAGIDGACARDAVLCGGGRGGNGVGGREFSPGLPLLPLTPLATIGNSFAVRVNAANLVDQTARFGGIASSNPNSASAPVALTSVAIDASGNALVGGSFAPSRKPEPAGDRDLRSAAERCADCGVSIDGARRCSSCLGLQREPVRGRSGVSCQADGSGKRGGGNGGAGALGGRLAQPYAAQPGIGAGDRSADRGHGRVHPGHQLRHDTGRGRRVQHCADGHGAGKHYGVGGELDRADAGPARAGIGGGAASGCLLAEGAGLRRGQCGLGRGDADHYGDEPDAAEPELRFAVGHRQQDHAALYICPDGNRLHAVGKQFFAGAGRGLPHYDRADGVEQLRQTTARSSRTG